MNKPIPIAVPEVDWALGDGPAVNGYEPSASWPTRPLYRRTETGQMVHVAEVDREQAGLLLDALSAAGPPAPTKRITRAQVARWARTQRKLNAMRVVAGTFTSGFDNALACLLAWMGLAP